MSLYSRRSCDTVKMGYDRKDESFQCIFHISTILFGCAISITACQGTCLDFNCTDLSSAPPPIGNLSDNNNTMVHDTVLALDLEPPSSTPCEDNDACSTGNVTLFPSNSTTNNNKNEDDDDHDDLSLVLMGLLLPIVVAAVLVTIFILAAKLCSHFERRPSVQRCIDGCNNWCAPNHYYIPPQNYYHEGEVLQAISAHP